jgi:hypothetical protein
VVCAIRAVDAAAKMVPHATMVSGFEAVATRAVRNARPGLQLFRQRVDEPDELYERHAAGGVRE